MRIRKLHPIGDRIKLLLLLVCLLLVLINLARIVYEKREEKKQVTIESLLQTALEPVGTTMYIWGGGWNGTDDGSGATSTQLGLSPRWKEFAMKQDESYDFNKHRYEREQGLDCSGYVGWVIYNTFETESGLSGYVTASTDFASSLAQRGWGKLIENPKEFLPGDIVSMEGHVWICMGTCEDGSVLLVHSSPPGVSVCGTSVEESKAVFLATEYMTANHPEWQKKYPKREVSEGYLKNVTLFRWSNEVMWDAKELQRKSAEEVLRFLQ